MEKKWEEMTPEERQEVLIQRWLSPKDPQGENLKFKTPEAEAEYKARVQRLVDAIQLKKVPDRVPVLPLPNMFPVYYYGITVQEAMYDYEKCFAAFKKFVLDFQPDATMGCMGPGPGRFYDLVDYKVYRWPGHGVGPNQCYQAVEDEYMKADEYDALVTDPTYYFLTVYFPRAFGSLKGLSLLSPPTYVLEFYPTFSAVHFIPFALPPVQEALKVMAEAGAEVLKWIQGVVGWNLEIMASGFPLLAGGGCKAPFDTIGDTLRGTKGIIIDMYRQPEKVLKAVEALVPIMIKMGSEAAKQNGVPLVFMPLHKGADGFMSDQQFKTFYWPTLKKVILGLIEEGCIPFLVAEGGFNSRLEVIKDLPKGKVVWMFDQTDMAQAKKTLGDSACIAGNVPTDLLAVGTPEQVKEYVKKLIDTCADGGGFILTNGAFFDEAKPENVKAMVEFVKEYGVYR
jgi:hypothetical protein